MGGGRGGTHGWVSWASGGVERGVEGRGRGIEKREGVIGESSDGKRAGSPLMLAWKRPLN
jgi:hypothetical protein